MATIHQSNAAKGIEPVAYPSYAGQAVTQRYSFAVPADIAEGDIIELACIPAGCRPVEVIVDSDDLDTGSTAAIVWDIGVMSGDWGSTDSDRTCGDEFFDGTTISQAGGAAHPTIASAYRVAVSSSERSIGAKLVTDAATAKAGTIGITVTCVAA